VIGPAARRVSLNVVSHDSQVHRRSIASQNRTDGCDMLARVSFVALADLPDALAAPRPLSTAANGTKPL
jgi:hypothetical protein